MEGYDAASLEFGTANAKTITISFYVKSSITGTHGGAVGNGSDNRFILSLIQSLVPIHGKENL